MEIGGDEKRYVGMKCRGNEMMIIVAQGRNEFRPWARIYRIPAVPDIMILTFAHFNGQNQASI